MSVCAQSVAPHLHCLRLVGFCRLRCTVAGAADTGPGDVARSSDAGAGGAARTSVAGPGDAARTSVAGPSDAARLSVAGPGDAARTSDAGPGGAARSAWAHAHRLYHVFALAATFTYVLQQFIYAYQERGDMDKLSQVMFVLLCHVTCVAKQLVFHLDADALDALVAGLDEPLLNQTAGAGGALLRGTARDAARLLRTYSGCAVATCVLWIVFPVLYRIQGIHFEFPFWTGVSYEHNFVFGVVLLYSFYTTNLVAIGNTTMDAFVATILDQCKTQLRILRLNLETLPQRASAAHAASGQHYDASLHELFVDCLLHYNKITEMCAALHALFGVPLLVQFGVGGWILCMAAYKIVSLNVLSIEFASTTLFIICILVELFIFCYYGNEVTVESDLVSESLYCMEWSRTPLSFRRSLVLAMEGAKRPLRPAAGRVIPLSLDTYVTILKSSYSFYAVLRQTK